MTAENPFGRDTPRYRGPAVAHRITLSGLANGSVRAVCEPCGAAGEPWARTFEGGRYSVEDFVRLEVMHGGGE